MDFVFYCTFLNLDGRCKAASKALPFGLIWSVPNVACNAAAFFHDFFIGGVGSKSCWDGEPKGFTCMNDDQVIALMWSVKSSWRPMWPLTSAYLWGGIDRSNSSCASDTSLKQVVRCGHGVMWVKRWSSTIGYEWCSELDPDLSGKSGKS